MTRKSKRREMSERTWRIGNGGRKPYSEFIALLPDWVLVVEDRWQKTTTNEDEESDAERDDEDARMFREHGHDLCTKIAQLTERLAAAAKFKTYVHQRLDEAGVPHGEPENEHQKAGCRIGARLDLLFRDRARLIEALKKQVDIGSVASADDRKSARDLLAELSPLEPKQ